MGVFRRCVAVAGLALLLPGIHFSSGAQVGTETGLAEDEATDDALRIAEQVTGEVEGPIAPPKPPAAEASAQALLQEAAVHTAPAPAAAEPAAPAADDSQVAVDATNAHVAAATAKQAAEVANKVAVHSVKLTEHAKSALENAHEALHKARVNAAGLSSDQKESLKKAEAKLKKATKDAEYGQVKNAKYVKADVENKKLQKLEDKMDTVKEKQAKDTETNGDDELEAMRQDIKEIRKSLKKTNTDQAENDEILKELDQQIEEMEKSDKKGDKKAAKSHDEMKAEIERLRAEVAGLEDEQPAAPAEPAPKKAEEEETDLQDESLRVGQQARAKTEDEDEDATMQNMEQATPVDRRGIDIDTAMPYGDLEPFGREDTAQELTEDSIKESNAMVDQLEKAQVAEEKRAVFRALTRLRGAAITSFDSIARAQTGQMDEYNMNHQWRRSHPLHHLADEESDVSKWAFPENADF